MDSYAPCPCGSGKKVKFCCQAILPEMAKIERLQENNQPHMAIQLIDKVLKEHPDNGWLVTQRAMALFNREAFEEARDGLVPFLRKNPEHPLANAMLALAVVQSDTMEKSKKVIHRAFLKSMADEHQLVAILAGKLVSHFLEIECDMAARQHMAIVLRLGSEEDRQRTLMAMLELDADTTVPYPLRGGHPLPTYEAPPEMETQQKKSQRLYIHGCFSEAADILDKIAEVDPASPQLWHTIGLMRAWDGDELNAAKAFHKAAGLYEDFDQAVDLEALAQLLDRRQKDNSIPSRMVSYETESLSKLLTRLDNDDQLCRVPVMEEQTGISASYDILDRNLPTEKELEELSLETAPRSIGRLMLVDQADPSTPAAAHVTAIEGERLEQSIQIFEAAAGELATPAKKEEEEVEDSDVISWYAEDDLVLTESAFFPPKTPPEIRQKLRKEFIDKCIHETWANSPQKALNGKTPLEASKDESLKVALAAAVRVFDSFLDRRDIILDQAELRDKLNVPHPTPIPPSDDLDLNTLTVTQLQDISFEGMSDKLFDLVMQRALVVKHCGFGYRTLTEFLKNRPELVKENEQETQQAYANLADICSRSLKEDEALEWIQLGFEQTKSQGGPFEAELMWKMRELQFRSRYLNDPELKQLLLELWNYYGAKLPVVRERLEQFIQTLEIDPPWENAIITPETSGDGEAGWSAQPQGSESGEKKLWLPD
ncbi:hypothetical protein [Thalassoglobus polymorphus]|uniref:SEC-C motif protein n=1 Tax=Thalassoglobus polymorphus TaxID=2527994 RepID=A0A517QT36_9PLAN|nr:hypothetical protein [Thalassoglobus polymorphus]QDT34801.1 SEC-C motif protein [Thalassoglobus polymorphus]